MIQSNWAMVKSNRAMVKSNWAIDLFYPLPKIRRRQCRVPTIFIFLLIYFHTMPYDPEKHHRRSVRLKGYDYTQPGVYYITICTKERQCIFGEVINGKMQLNFLGYLAHICWLDIPNHFSCFQLDTFVIMPDHIHGLLAIVNNTLVTTQQKPVPTREKFGQPVRGSIPTAIRSYKGAVTRFIHRFCETTEVPVWQDGFYESIIRDEKTLNCKRQYIINNPQRWGDNPQKLEHHKNHPILLDSRF